MREPCMQVYNSVRRVDCVIATAMGEIAMVCEWSGRALSLYRTVCVRTVARRVHNSNQ
jgi:hypothetical protein